MNRVGSQKRSLLDVLSWQFSLQNFLYLFRYKNTSLLVFFGAETSISIRQFDGQLTGAFDNVLALLGGNRVGNLTAEASVHHHENFQFLERKSKTFCK